jgi:hypothetical protein
MLFMAFARDQEAAKTLDVEAARVTATMVPLDPGALSA